MNAIQTEVMFSVQILETSKVPPRNRARYHNYERGGQG